MLCVSSLDHHEPEKCVRSPLTEAERPLQLMAGLPMARCSTGSGGVVLLQVFSMSGAKLCEFRAGLRASVECVKQRVFLSCDIPVAEQRLVFAGAILRNDDTLEDCGLQRAGVLGKVSMLCVRCCQSQLARSLADLSGDANPELAVEATLGALTDTAMRAEHELSECSRPSTSDLLNAVAPQHRAELINWMMQAFDVLRFDPGLLHSVILTMDRYFIRRAKPVDVTEMQKLLLAIVCTEMKMAGAGEFPPGHWQRVLAHLCHYRIELPEILAAEYEVLSCMGFDVGIPTAFTFLRELAVRPRCDDGDLRAIIFDLAMFFLDLCVFEPDVQYGYSHCILAGGAFAAALRVLDADVLRRDRCADLREQLFDNLMAYGVRADRTLEAAVFGCEAEILELWCARARGQGTCAWSPFYRAVVTKYERRVFARGGAVLSSATAASTLDRLFEARASGRRR
mmetsp:Transcript_95102/g.273811  ORF Transcript_95102/g.273811 Transcript_95102/m.273811 type:complete len:454 (+) Transcript_95102:57-1418(+)